jgi:CD109 antigen
MSEYSPCDYMLEVTGVSGFKFKSNKALHLNTKKCSVFVQTDKAIYKPSDLVQFRILVVDSETKPYDTSNVVIYITDGAENRVKQYENPIFKKGVFQNEMQLSDLPVLGTWNIHVKVDGEEEVLKSFDVAEYVLPKFEVTIDANPNQIFKNGKIVAKVKAKYTFGKQVKGTTTVTAHSENRYGWNDDNDQHKVSKTVENVGESVFEFDFDELRLFQVRGSEQIQINAIFKDKLTGKEATASAKVTVHESPYQINLIASGEKFKPGFPFSVKAIVSRCDNNAPITDNINPVIFKVVYKYDVLRRISNSGNKVIDGKRLKPGEEYECWETQSYEKEYKIFPFDGNALLDVECGNQVYAFKVNVRNFSSNKIFILNSN